MPATKKPAAERAVATKTPAKKTAKQTVLVGPTYKDPKIDALVKRFDATLKAMSAEAVRTVKAFHASKLEVVKGGSFGIHDIEVMRSFYPPLRLGQYLDMHWELMKALAKHHVSPTKRNETSVISRRDALLDHLDQWEIEPLYRAWQEREDRGAGGREFRAYQAAKREQRRVRLGLTPAQFAQLLKNEKAAYDAHAAAEEQRFRAERKERKAQEKAKKTAEALA